MIECVRRTSRNVKRWQSGETGLRWTAARMIEAEQQFRKINDGPGAGALDEVDEQLERLVDGTHLIASEMHNLLAQ
jgi:hypothetical protein